MPPHLWSSSRCRGDSCTDHGCWRSITPSFTSNWLTRQGSEKRPAPLGRFDIGSIALGAIALVAWIAAPDWYGTAALLLLMAIAQAARLSRWAGEQTWREPILFVLHVGYAFVPLGALILSLSIPWPQMMPASGALHAWTTGAMGTMTLAIMTRAISGTLVAIGFHAGNDSNLRRYAGRYFVPHRGAPLPAIYYQALLVAGVAWLLAFGIFLLVYGPMLLGAKQTS